MKSRRKKLVLIIAGILLIALILNAIFTWGIIFSHSGGFFSSTTSLFEDIITDGYAHVSLGGEFSNPVFCIPFVFGVYGIESPPYPIRLAIRDDADSFRKFYLKSLLIEYVDGQKIDRNIEWERDFETDFPSLPAKYVIDKLPVNVERRQSCNIKFVGYFINKEGDKIPFDTTKEFEYEAHEWSVFTVRGSF